MKPIAQDQNDKSIFHLQHHAPLDSIRSLQDSTFRFFDSLVKRRGNHRADIFFILRWPWRISSIGSTLSPVSRKWYLTDMHRFCRATVMELSSVTTTGQVGAPHDLDPSMPWIQTWTFNSVYQNIISRTFAIENFSWQNIRRWFICENLINERYLTGSMTQL